MIRIEILIPLFYSAFVAAHAAIDWYLIKVKDKKINHKKESYWYAVFSFIVFWLFLFISEAPFWSLIAFPLLARAAFFDPLLNWFTEQPFVYEGDPNKPKEERSWYDDLERRLKFKPVVYRVIYFCAMGVFTVFYYIIIL